MTENDVQSVVDEAFSQIKGSSGKREDLLKRLREECITKSWQLESLSHEQWQSMDAPIGFVVILKSCLEKHAESRLSELKAELNDDMQNFAEATAPSRRRSSSRRLRRQLSKPDISLDNPAARNESSQVRQRRRYSFGGRRNLSKSPVSSRGKLMCGRSTGKESDANERNTLGREKYHRRLPRSVSARSVGASGSTGDDFGNPGRPNLRSNFRRSSSCQEIQRHSKNRRLSRHVSPSTLEYSMDRRQDASNDIRQPSIDHDGQCHRNSPHHIHIRCRSESPSRPKKFLVENNPGALLGTNTSQEVRRQTTSDDIHPLQFQPSLQHAIACNEEAEVNADEISIQSGRSISSSSIMKDAESGWFLYLKRGKVMYEWHQTFETMELRLPKPKEVPDDNFLCTIEESSIQVGRKGAVKPFFNRLLGGKCVPEKSVWVPYGGVEVKGAIVHLMKANPGQEWKRPFLSSHHQLSIVGPGSRRRRRSMGKKQSSSQSLDALSEERPHSSPAIPSTTGKKKVIGFNSTPQHSNKCGYSSAYSTDLKVGHPQQEEAISDGFFSKDSLQTLQSNGLERDRNHGVDKKRRCFKKGTRHLMRLSASMKSPFKTRSSKGSLATVSTVDSDSPNLRSDKEQLLGFRTSFTGNIDAVVKDQQKEQKFGDTYYPQFDDASTPRSTNTESPRSTTKALRPTSESNFATLLVQTAPLPFDDDSNTVSTLGSQE